MRKKNQKKDIINKFSPLPVGVILLGIWFFTCELGVFSPYVLPGPEKVFDSFLKMLQSGELLTDIMVSFGRVVKGFLIAFVMAFCLLIFAGNLATVGSCRYFMENREHKTPFSQMFYGFTGGRYNNCMTTMLVRWLIVFGYSLLLIIPGIIKSYSYFSEFYLFKDSRFIW